MRKRTQIRKFAFRQDIRCFEQLEKVAAYEAAVQAATDKVKFFVPSVPIIGLSAEHSKSLFAVDDDFDNARIEEDEEEVEIADDEEYDHSGAIDLMQQFAEADSR